MTPLRQRMIDTMQKESMANLGFVEAFAIFAAKLDNPMWAVSAIAADGSMVMSCWSHYFGPGEKDVLRYTDYLDRWNGNKLGNSLLKRHLSEAFENKLPVRLVVATTTETETVDQGHDASKVKKTFHVREEVVGDVTYFDGNNYVIDFRRKP